MKTKIILTFFITILQALSQTAVAQDYCNSKGKNLITYFAPRLGAEKQEVKNYQNGIEAVFLKLQVGDKLEVLIAHDVWQKAFQRAFLVVLRRVFWTSSLVWEVVVKQRSPIEIKLILKGHLYPLSKGH